MTFENFRKAVNEVYSSFDLQKLPPDRTVYLWFKKAQFIPDEAIGFILDDYLKEMENKPRNLGLAFKKGWALYKQAHPEKIISEGEREDCAECGGRGFFECARLRWGIPYTYVQPCKCKNSYFNFDGSIPRATKEELQEKGFTIL